MHPGDVLKLGLRKQRMAGALHLAHVSRFCGRNVKQNIHLLGRGVGSAFCDDPGTIISVLLHELANVLQGKVELFEGMKLSQLKLGGVNDLVAVRAARSAFDVNGADKKVERSGEGEDYIVA